MTERFTACDGRKCDEHRWSATFFALGLAPSMTKRKLTQERSLTTT